ncbi:tryptophan--tRNA ligase [Candidatus Campbellbacteria bacterium]|nr:tryptophan--tRNA ligase [Candidatus Campbellbacteria bacterium]|tara:strand:- start:49 stop:1026 length:978 start_codon:yes stop_codon:yes gene_type:complete
MKENNKKIALSGIQPTGTPHIGNYFGAMKQFVEMQDEFNLHVFVAEYHAMTTVQDKKTLKENIHNLILDYLAIGLDPEKVTLYRQSDIPELTELTWMFNCLVTVPWLERAHAFKDKSERGIEATVGLFNYPVLMAADILLPNSQIVPVGKDQIQHVEMAREIARKFNNTYGNTFSEPEEHVVESTQTVPGTDGQKMSKSYGNTIPLFGTDAEIKKAIMGIVTDSKLPEEPKNPDECNVFALHRLITPEPELSEIKKGYEDGGLGYGDSKKMLLKNYLAFITPMRAKRKYYEDNPGIVRQILDEGRTKIQAIGREKMKEVREKVGL